MNTTIDKETLEQIIQGVIAGLRAGDADAFQSPFGRGIEGRHDDRGPDTGPWTVKQAARRLGVCEKTVRKLEASGQLRCERIGQGRGTLRFWPKDLEDYRELTRGTPALKSTDARRKRLLKL